MSLHLTLRACATRRGAVKCPFSNYSHNYREFSRARSADPLRILFCGADEFSAASLRRLTELHAAEPQIVESIDVVCRKGKLQGRGLSNIREVPLKSIAQSLGLPVHEIPTFTGWQPPTRNGQPLNLVIAVSFGLLVPPRILNGASYGGVNLHPSLLPALRGPAPLHHTLINGLQRSGVTLQTMHPKDFDRGGILCYNAFDLGDEHTRSLSTLQHFMALKGGDLLVSALRDGLFIPPLDLKPPPPGIQQSHAPKLTPDDARIDWNAWDSDRVLRTQKALGVLWNNWPSRGKDNAVTSTRIQWHDLRLFDLNSISHGAGKPIVLEVSPLSQVAKRIQSLSLGGIATVDGKFLVPDAITIAGKKARHPNESVAVVERLHKLAVDKHQALI